MSSEHDDRPAYLQALFPRKHKPDGAVVALPAMPVAQGLPYATKALQAELQALSGTAEGGRNDQLNESAFNLAQLVAGGYLDRAQVEDGLRSTALAIGLPSHEVENTLASGMRAGEQQPRQVPAQHREALPAVTVLPTVLAQQEALTSGDASDEDKAAAAEAIEALFPLVNWRDLYLDETEDEWIIEPLLPARRLVALFSPPKMGKSLLVLEIAAALSLGRMCLGRTLPRPYRVLYVDFENDPRGDVRSRLLAMGYRHWEDLGNLCYLSFPSLAYLDTAMGGLQLLAVAQHYGCEVVIIDTISRAVQGEENDNDTWLGFYRNTGLRLKAAGIACLRLDHTGKDTSKGMRGGSAKYGDVDAVWSLTALSDDTFKLECTDNRLPIAEKELVLRRKPLPELHHAVDLEGRQRVWHERVNHAVAWLHSIKWPKDKGRGGLWDDDPKMRARVQAAGITKAALTEALARYKDQPTVLP